MVFTPSLSEACVILVTPKGRKWVTLKEEALSCFHKEHFFKIQFTFGNIFSFLRMFQIADSVSPGS